LIEVRFRVRAAPVAVAEARRRVTALGDLPAHVLRDAELVVSELLTNSLLHAELGDDDVIDVALRRDDERLVIEVNDHDGLYAESGRHPEPRRGGGMGLRFLDAICDHWHADTGRVIATIPI
jgi:anti-sigma regulatory factor (Ser/Thr protein kinase)